jgi:hypothetical protein
MKKLPIVVITFMMLVVGLITIAQAQQSTHVQGSTWDGLDHIEDREHNHQFSVELPSRVELEAPEGESARVVLTPSLEEPYPLFGWKGMYKCPGKLLGSMTTHELTRPKDTDGDGVHDTRYAHDHFSIYSVDSNCKLVGRIDIPFGYDHTQMQIEFMDIVFKTEGSGLILRNNSKYCKLNFDPNEPDVDPNTDGIQHSLTCTRYDWQDVIIANKPPSERGYPAELDTP